jgi:hypothetical protein
MTRIPATMNDPLLQTHLKGSDFSRTTDLGEGTSDFYKTFLSAAPLQHLGQFTSGLSLEHLETLPRKSETPSSDDARFESRSRDSRSDEPERRTENVDRDRNRLRETETSASPNNIGDLQQPRFLDPRIQRSYLAIEPAVEDDSEPSAPTTGRPIQTAETDHSRREDRLTPTLEAANYVGVKLPGVASAEADLTLPAQVQPSEVKQSLVQVTTEAAVHSVHAIHESPNATRTRDLVADAAKSVIEEVSLVTVENDSAVSDAEETIEISFKSDAPVVQKPDRLAARENRRRVARDEGRKRSIGQRPGFQEPSHGVATRADRSTNVKPVGAGAGYSLDEIPVPPLAQRTVVQAGQTAAAATALGLPGTELSAEIALEMPGQLDAFLTPNASAGPTPNSVATSASVGSTVAGALATVDVSASADGQLTNLERTQVPNRVLNQVAQALKQVPAGNSTMRLQLNPVELGQVMIEISFRDGVMHGKLRAEHGPTLRLLQEGIEGLRARLNEQGIVVQALEVELGKDGDFAQQRSFSQSQEFGQQRQSNGYFTGEGLPVRRSTPEKQPDITSTSTPIDGRWAVNVIV